MSKLTLNNGKAVRVKTALEIAMERVETNTGKGATVAELKARVEVLENLVKEIIKK